MKKLAFFAVLLGLLLAACGAPADSCPVNPERGRAEELHFLHRQRLRSRGSGGDNFELNVLTAPGYGTEGVFEIVKNIEGGNYTYAVQVYDENLDDDMELVFYFEGVDMTFTVPSPMLSSDYCLTLFCEDMDANRFDFVDYY